MSQLRCHFARAATCLFLCVIISTASAAESGSAARPSERELGKLSAFLRSPSDSSIAHLGASLGLDASNMPTALTKEGADGEYDLAWSSKAKANFVSSVRFIYRKGDVNFLVEYEEIQLSASVCLKVGDLERALGAKQQYTSGFHVNFPLNSWEIVEKNPDRSVFLDQIKTSPPSPGLPSSEACVVQFNVDAEPSVLFSDRPN